MSSAKSSKSDKSPRHFPVRLDWLAAHEEEILEPDLPIIDPHHHLWDRRDNRYLMEDLRADLDSGHNIVGTVYVQCFEMYNRDAAPEMAPLGETEFVNGVAAFGASGKDGDRRMCAGIVGHADLTLGAAVSEVLEAHQRISHRFRGIRHISAWDEDENLRSLAYDAGNGLLAETPFREGFAQLRRLGLTFDAWLYHPQIPDLTNLARAFPDTRIILDHVGGPLGVGRYRGKRAEIFNEWRASIRALAACSNVSVKIGGLLMRVNGFDLEDGETPPDSTTVADIYRPYFDVCLEAFGAHRCMFESNFPVDKGSVNYPVFWNACKRLAGDLSDDEKSALFTGTASRVYNLTVPALA